MVIKRAIKLDYNDGLLCIFDVVFPSSNSKVTKRKSIT